MVTVAAAVLLAPAARADEPPAHRLGDHPAIVVQRLYKAAGYDYASKFYPHPAGLRLYAEPPHDATDGASAASMLADTEALPTPRSVARDATALPKSGTRSGG
jgi:hypothetical protein